MALAGDTPVSGGPVSPVAGQSDPRKSVIAEIDEGGTLEEGEVAAVLEDHQA